MSTCLDRAPNDSCGEIIMDSNSDIRVTSTAHPADPTLSQLSLSPFQLSHATIVTKSASPRKVEYLIGSRDISSVRTSAVGMR